MVDKDKLELGMEMLGEPRMWPAAEVRGFIYGAVMALMAAGLDESEAVKHLAEAAPRLGDARGWRVIPEEYQGEWRDVAMLYME